MSNFISILVVFFLFGIGALIVYTDSNTGIEAVKTVGLLLIIAIVVVFMDIIGNLDEIKSLIGGKGNDKKKN